MAAVDRKMASLALVNLMKSYSRVDLLFAASKIGLDVDEEGAVDVAGTFIAGLILDGGIENVLIEGDFLIAVEKEAETELRSKAKSVFEGFNGVLSRLIREKAEKLLLR